jgi:hypothetical protein
MEPTSLDDFVDDGDADAQSPAGETALGTYRYSPAGTACVECEATVERAWRAEAGLVCPDCKPW